MSKKIGLKLNQFFRRELLKMSSKIVKLLLNKIRFKFQSLHAVSMHLIRYQAVESNEANFLPE